MYKIQCGECRELFNYIDEMQFLLGDVEVVLDETYPDWDTSYCINCYNHKLNKKKENENMTTVYLTLDDAHYIMDKFGKVSDRIEILENRLNELEGTKCELLSDSEKQAVIEHKGKIKPTQNQRRDNIIWKAKEFINRHSKGYGVFEFGMIHYIIDFKISKNKRTVKALLIGAHTGYVHKRKTVTCHPDDVFNEYLGKAIAIGRLLELDVSHFEDAPQPDKWAVGQIITVMKTSVNHMKWKYKIDSINNSVGNLTKLFSDGGKANADLRNNKISELPIIEDTDADYSNLHK